MAHRTVVPQFGDWESQNDVPYTVFFEKARKKQGKKIINPENPVMDRLLQPESVRAGRQEDINLRQFNDSKRNGNDHRRSSMRATNSNTVLFEHLPDNNRLPAKAVGKGNARSTNWDDNSFGKSRARPTRGEESSNKGVVVPKFGAWNENDPQSAAKFTDIFDKVREERNNEVSNASTSASNKCSPFIVPTDSAKPSVDPKKCCFPWW